MENIAMEVDEPTEAAKMCPVCAETILQAGVKCRSCGEFLNKPQSSQFHDSQVHIKWYFSKLTTVLGLLCMGLLALPLVWFNPSYKVLTKIVITIAVCLVAVLTFYLAVNVSLWLIKGIEALGIRAL